MTKTKEIEEMVFSALYKNWSITKKSILESESDIDSKDEIIKIVKFFLLCVKNNEIKHLEFSGDINETIKYVVELFPIGLHELDPVDFEGDEPNSIEEMIETTSYFILQDVKLNKIPNLRFVV